MPPETLGRTIYGIEYECGLDRAVTDISFEMNACQVASSVTGLVYSAWDDGSDWDDGAIGWDDWPLGGSDL